MGSAARSMKRRADRAAGKAKDREKREAQAAARRQVAAQQRSIHRGRARQARRAGFSLEAAARALAPGSVVIGPDGQRKPIWNVTGTQTGRVREGDEETPSSPPDDPPPEEEQSP